MGISCLNVNDKATVMQQENCHTDDYTVSSVVVHFFHCFFGLFSHLYRLVTMDDYFSLLRY